MLELLKRFVYGYWNLLNNTAQDATEAWDNRDWRYFCKNIGLILLLIADAVGLSILAVFLLWKFRNLLLALAIPPSILALLIANYRANHPSKVSKASVPVLDTVDLTRANANRTYRPMAQCAFLLFTELCRYLPGLVKPFSLAAVEAPVHFDITASMVTLYHFVIGKGENDAPVSAIAEILNSIIGQHLQAQDLPLSVPAAYTGVDGSTWPGMVVDGVYDLGQTYRIDLAITNEAVISRLRARAASGPDGYDLGGQPVHDADFD